MPTSSLSRQPNEGHSPNRDNAAQRAAVLNAFRPNGEMEAPSGFAGRRQQVLDLVDSLYVSGSCPIIYGERGLGKSSLANQVGRIAVGDIELLDELGVPERALPEEFRFTAFWVSCSDETTNKTALFRRLINRAEGYSTVDAFNNSSQETMTSKDRIDLKFVTSETTKVYTRRAFSKLDVEEQLLAVSDTLRDQGHRRQLFIIDELDRVDKTHGLASFIKNHSDENTKFLLVGIADNISTLLDDHESLERHVNPVIVPPMTRGEQFETVRKALDSLEDDHGVRMSFTEGALRAISEAARGFPWFIHILGQDAVLREWERGNDVVNESGIELSIKSLASNRFAQKYSDKYTQAVGDSLQREIVLRVMARWSAHDVPVSEIYKVAKQLGVTNPSMAKKDLEKKKYGSVLLSPQRGIVRFRNALFKRYVDLRSSIFSKNGEHVTKLVNEKFDQHYG